MKKTTIVSLFSWLALALTPGTFAQGTAVTYQGRLADAGSPANGFFDITFSIWDTAAGPAQVGGTLTNTAVEVTDGLFTVTLDFGAGIFTGPDRWLEIGVTTNGGGAFTTLAPRTEINATPYAIHAGTAVDAATATTATTVVGGIDDADANPANELNISLNLVGTDLELTDAGGLLSVDLAPLVSDNGWDYFSGSGLSGELFRSGDVALGTLSDPDGHGLNVQNYSSGKAAIRGVDQSSGGNLYAEGMLGVLSASTFLPPSLSSAVNAGVIGIKHNLGSDGAAVVGWNQDGGNKNMAGAFLANGTNTGQNIAVYARAENGTENIAALLEGDVIVDNDYLEVKGSADEQAYIGGDGAGNDVQIGSLRSNVVNVATWNAATGSRMHFIASNITSVGTFFGDGSGLTGIGSSALGPDSVGTSEIINNQVFAADLANDNSSLSKVTSGTMTDTGTRIGIGTATPSDTLHIFDSGNNGDVMIENTFPFLTFNRNSTTGNSGISFEDNGSTKGYLIWRNSDKSILLTATGSGTGVNGLIASSAGNVGAGRVPVGARLEVQGTSTTDTTDAMIVYNSASTDLFHIENSGQTGMGTTAPAARLQVDGNGTEDILRVRDAGSTKFIVNGNGQVAINTLSPATNYELSVNGQIVCEEILVQDSGSWPDYVFAEDYDLKPLEEVESHIKQRKHLPGIPTAEQVAADGISVGDMQKRMMEKIEELTLYVIDQNNRLATQEDRISELQTQLALQEAR